MLETRPFLKTLMTRPGKAPWLVLTPGDPKGIGPEVTEKAFRDKKNRKNILCVGASAPIKDLGLPIEEISVREILTHHHIPEPPAGRIWCVPAPKNRSTGFQSGWSIQTAVEIIQEGFAQGIVTGPIHKKRLNEAGFRYQGHTDFLADLSHTKSVTMMLANRHLRVSLVTTHCSLKSVPSRVTSQRLHETVEQTMNSLHRWFGVEKPRIAIAALNPHAGEEGLLGTEDRDLIAPTVRKMKKKYSKKASLFGPLPSDTLFAQHIMAPPKERYDAVVCMYHDQGLIPVKLLDFPNTVNITLGLPFIRTSVDHGVGFDIAGKGVADPSSMIAAIKWARKLVAQQEKKKKDIQ